MPTFKDHFLDIIFPRHCLGCDILLDGESLSYICRFCLNSISFTAGFACAFCKSPVRAGKTCVYCVKDHHLDQLLVTASYENPLVEKILKTMKYRFVQSLTENVAELMIRYFKKTAKQLENKNSIVIVPVPLHRQRFNWRGFNQAEIVALKIGEYFGWLVITDVLKRIRNPRPQADIDDRLSRIKNMRGVFGTTDSDSLVGKTILLIDDISTTGSTLNDCARALKGAGAKEVIGFVFARGRASPK